MEWSLPPSCCRHKAWAPCPHLVATTPCPSAGCLWALSQEAPRRKLGGKPPCSVLQERREKWWTEAMCNQSQAFAARWVLREQSSKQGTARFSEESSHLAPPLGRFTIFSGPDEMYPQISKTVLSMAHPFASGKGREAQSRCQFALGQTPGAWIAERALSKPQRSNLAQLLAGRGGGGCMQLPVSMCKTCTRHRLTQPELVCARKSRNQPRGRAWFSEVRG